jgi:hypothetical protein
VASRLFLVGTEWSQFRSDTRTDFLALGGLDWVQRLERNDPVLDGVLLEIRDRPSPAAYLLGLDRLYDHYPDRDRVPDAFRADGYVSATTDGEVARIFVFHPDVPEPDFRVNCSTDDPLVPADRFLTCSFLASYPLDPEITLKASMFLPPPFSELQPRFEPIVERMREIALCLDVTDAPPADPQRALEALLAAKPRLEGCDGNLPF